MDFDKNDHTVGDGNAPANLKIDLDFKDKPMYRDGISSSNTYLIMAVKKTADGSPIEGDEYNCICQGNGKIKFYPSLEHFNMTELDLETVGINIMDKRSHNGYVRYYCNRRTAAKLLHTIASTRGTIACTPNMVLEAPSTGNSPLSRASTTKGKNLHGYPGSPTQTGIDDEDEEDDFTTDETPPSTDAKDGDDGDDGEDDDIFFK